MARQNETTERQGQIRELAARIARERIAPDAAECDRTEAFHGKRFALRGKPDCPE